MKFNGKLTLAAIVAAVLVPVVLFAQGYPRWTGSLTGIADWTGAQFSSANPFPVTPGAIAPVSASTTLESSHVLKASSGVLLGFQVNTTSAAEWVMLFDATAAPADGAVTPKAWWQVPANTTLSVAEVPMALIMSSGIVLVCSTTGPFTKTASALCTFSAGEVQ